MKCLEDYTIVSRREDNGTYSANVPAISGCYAWGRTRADALSELDHVFDMIREEYEELGRELPEDVGVVIARAS